MEGKGRVEAWGREIQTLENPPEFVVSVVYFSFVVVSVVVCLIFMLHIFPVHRQKEKSQNLSLNCLISNLWKKWMMKHSARPYVFRFGSRFSFFFNLNFFDSPTEAI